MSNHDRNYVSGIKKNISSNYLRMILTVVITFITSIIYARVLGPNVYGVYTYTIWLISIISSLCGFGLEGTLTKFIPEYYFSGNKDESNTLLEGILRKQIINIFVICIIIISTLPIWKSSLKLNYQGLNIVLILAITNVLPTILNSIFVSTLQALQKFDLYAKVNIQVQLLTLLFTTIAVILTRKVEFMIAISLIFTIYQVYRYYKYLKEIVGIDLIKSSKKVNKLNEHGRIKKYARLMYVNIVWQQVVWTRSEFFFLGIYSGASEIAVYGLAYSLVNMVGMIFTPIMTVLNNYFSEMVAKDEKKLLEDLIFYVSKNFSIFLIPIFTVSLIFIKPIIILLYSNRYNKISMIFPIILLGLVMTQLTSVPGALPFYYEKQKFVIWFGILCGICNIGFDLFLIPRYGSVGAAIGNASSQALNSLVMSIFVYRTFKLRFPKKQNIIIIIISFLYYMITTTLLNSLIIKIMFTIIFIPFYFYVLFKLKIIDDNDMNILKPLIRKIRRKI